jgi:hypothetical protein
MAARTGWRFWGPLALVLGGPLGLSGWTAESNQPADQETTAVVHSRGDAQHAGAAAKEASQDKEVMARCGEAAKQPANKPAAAGPSCEELVRAALKAEAAGNAAEHEKLLRRALERDPNYGPARWHLGYVRVGKEWLKWDEVQRRTASDPRITEYRRLFDEQAGTPAGELALARWCRDKGLEDHARFHWLHVLSFQPQNEEALKALGMRWFKGQLLTHDEIVVARQGQSESSKESAGPRAQRKDWAKYFAPRVTKWQRMIAEDEAAVASEIREDMEGIGKSSRGEYWAAVQAIDSILLLRSRWRKDAAAYGALSLKWIKLLDGMPEPPATVSLARHAVDHPAPEVRAAAADALKKRPKEGYVPILLARMQAPVEASFTLQPSFGSVTWGYTFYQEGPRADRAVTRVGTVGVVGRGPLNSPQGGVKDPGSDQTTRDRMTVNAMQTKRDTATVTRRAVAAAAATVQQVDQAVSAMNALIEEVNRRVRVALSRSTGTDCGESAPAWWDWWEDCQYGRYDLEKPRSDAKKKPLYESSSASQSQVEVSGYPAAIDVGHSCFPRGTVVWTLTGPVAIDTLKVGDRVLSQHPLTGELAFKPVLETTARKLRPMMKISVGPEVITATRGHPFLVAGEGWKVARELNVGMRLHGASGPVTVDALEDAPKWKPFYERLAEKPDADAGDDLAYNLVVDESHTYFVGAHKVLVFDDTFATLANQASTAAALAR